MRGRGLFLVLVAFAAVSACTSDSDQPAAPASTTLGGAADAAPTCEEWMTRPVNAGEVQNGCSVPLGGGVEGFVQAGIAAIECDDGRTLFFGEQGWGYVGEPMRPRDEPGLLAPQAEMDACPVPPMPPSPGVG